MLSPEKVAVWSINYEETKKNGDISFTLKELG